MTIHTKCRICGKDIVLVPSAKERSAITGQPESHFLKLFTTHPECFMQESRREFNEAVARINSENEEKVWRKVWQ